MMRPLIRWVFFLINLYPPPYGLGYRYYRNFAMDCDFWLKFITDHMVVFLTWDLDLYNEATDQVRVLLHRNHTG